MTSSPSHPDAGPSPAHESAWSSPRAWATLAVVTLVSLAADLLTKAWAFSGIASSPVEISRADVLRARHLSDLIPDHDPVVAWRHVLEFSLVLNPGAVFGIGAGKRWFFVVFTVAAGVFALYLFRSWTRPRDWYMHTALGLVLGGGIGNLYDRLVYACVRDFIHPLPGVRLPMHWQWPWGGDEVWPYVSNVADLLLIIGIAMLAWKTVRTPPQVRPSPPHAS